MDLVYVATKNLTQKCQKCSQSVTNRRLSEHTTQKADSVKPSTAKRTTGVRPPPPKKSNLPLNCVHTGSEFHPVFHPMVTGLVQGWRTSGSHAQNGTPKSFLSMRHSLLSHIKSNQSINQSITAVPFFFFVPAASLYCEESARPRVCTYTHIHT